jgi:hypothetical protein
LLGKIAALYLNRAVKATPQPSKGNAMRLCECNPDMKQCPDLGEFPVIFEVPEDPPQVRWVCEEHYKFLIEFKMAKDAPDDLVNSH